VEGLAPGAEEALRRLLRDQEVGATCGSTRRASGDATRGATIVPREAKHMLGSMRLSLPITALLRASAQLSNAWSHCKPEAQGGCTPGCAASGGAIIVSPMRTGATRCAGRYAAQCTSAVRYQSTGKSPAAVWRDSRLAAPTASRGEQHLGICSRQAT
jgi:hypothetical protein